MSSVPTIALSDGNTIPQLGFGTFNLDDEVAQRMVGEAFRVGYRHIDTAALYGNERGVGKAVAESGLGRDEIYLTTKLWNDAHEPADARKAIETSLTKLGLDYVDLYLIHWPAPVVYGDSFVRAWDALQEFKAEGLTRSIGVSNFHAEHLDALSGEVPVIDQIELHPTLAEVELRNEIQRRGIVVEAWSPLGRRSDLNRSEIVRVANAVGRSTSQVILRWHIQHGLVVIPKSADPGRIAENFAIFDFELTDDQMATIDSCDSGNRTGDHPATANW